VGPQERAYELIAKKKSVVEEPAEQKKGEEDGDDGDEKEEEEEEQKEEKEQKEEEKTVTGKKKKTLLIAKYLKVYDPNLRVGASFRTEQISQTVLRVLMRQFGKVHSGMVRSIL
jgi:TATA-binding protein-associated factor Taf7